MNRWNEIKTQITESPVWRSVFRHGYEDTPRNRILAVSGNVWLHLHPSKVRKHGVRLKFTWCMGGITFLMFLITIVTGVYLMFYYRPVAQYAYADMKYLEFDMPFGMLMRNMHRWAAHAMVIAVWLHMFRVFMTGSYKPPREFNCCRCRATGAHAASQLHRLSLTVGPAVDMGRHSRIEHGASHATLGPRGPIRHSRRREPGL